MTPTVVHVASGREWRGGQRQVWLLARELNQRGTSQTVVTTAGSELARRLAADGVRVHPTRWKSGLDPRVLPAIRSQLRGPALLHVHDAHSLTLAGLAAGFRGAPLIVTRRVTFPIRRRFFWRRACRVIAISGAVRDAILRAGIERSRIVVIPSALDPDVSQCSGLDVREGLGLAASSSLAVHLGALTPEKDQGTLIQAAARLVQDLPDLHWVIVGEGPRRAELERQIARLSLGERVHLLGNIADPHRALRQADVFVLSSTSEGLGSSILAAMALGIPVVATRVGGVPDLLESGSGLLVAPKDPASLASAVRRIFSDSALRASLVRTGRQNLEKFSVSAMADGVLSVYRSCAHFVDGS